MICDVSDDISNGGKGAVGLDLPASYHIQRSNTQNVSVLRLSGWKCWEAHILVPRWFLAPAETAAAAMVAVAVAVVVMLWFPPLMALCTVTQPKHQRSRPGRLPFYSCLPKRPNQNGFVHSQRKHKEIHQAHREAGV